jgi:putative ABC transport system substrate-binding protein
MAPAHGADPRKVPHIGIVWVGAFGSDKSGTIAGLRQGLAERGYVEGRTVVVEARYADGRAERVPELIAELLALKVDVLVTPGTPMTQAARRLTSTVPIVSVSGDPVGAGLVASLARPGGNVTGVSLLSGEYAPKWLELLKEAVPTLHRVAVLVNADNPTTMEQMEKMKAVAPRLGLEVSAVSIRPAGLDEAMAGLAGALPDGLVVPDDALLDSMTPRLVAFAAERRLPTIYGLGAYVAQGGLMSYSVSIFDVFRHAAGYVDHILKGASPSDLPVEQATEFVLRLNLNTAKAIGLTFPPALLTRADEVIE